MPSKLPKSYSRLNNIKLVLEYDGSPFFGFQRQKDQPTIQAALEKALERLFNRPLKISAAAGRTDAGVHARAQVVNFKVDSALALEKIQGGLNALLPKEIAVKKAEEAPPDFHARYSAKWKTYEYHVFNSEIRSPLLNGRSFRFPYPLDLKAIEKAARELTGRHDFKSFQSTGSRVKNSIRTIRSLRIQRRGKSIHFSVEADGFLYRMVRGIVGTLLEVGRGGLSLEDFSEHFKKRRRFVHVAPPQALTLASVKYQ